MISPRYNRQILLKGFGTKGQENLSRSRVLVIGAGGLGCPALQILAASGIGHIGIVDDDRISPDNLSRQILYTPQNIGQFKVLVAGEYLRNLNPEIEIVEYTLRLSNQNALELIRQYSIIVDGTDNFESRYMLNDAAVIMGKPLVFGAVSGFEGQMAVWNAFHKGKRSMQYRDAFPIPPLPSTFQNCNELGVLGVLTSIIGGMMAAEVIKIASEVGEPYINQIWTYNSWDHSSYSFHLKARTQNQASIPLSQEEFLAMDYGQFCSAVPSENLHISASRLQELMLDRNTTLIDVRERGELPPFSKWEHESIPLAELRSRALDIKGETLITLCYSGKRSDQAALLLKEILGTQKSIFSLSGGLMHWNP